jgi:hypothetical protein
MRCEYRVPTSNPPVRDRIGRVNAKLRNASGDVDMTIDPKCKELILDFEQVTYKEDSAEVDKLKDRRRTHLSDALGYLVWENAKPPVMAGPRHQRLI